MDKNRKYYIVIISVIAIFAIVVIIMSRSPESSQPPPQSNPVSVVDNINSEPEKEPKNVVPEQPSVPIAEETKISIEPEPAEEPIADVTPMDPEDQPREHFGIDFSNMADLPEGYKLEGLELTEKGIQITPPEPGEENTPRFGVLESAPEKMLFPSNAISPYWKEDLPDNTSIFVEVCVSPDGKTWSLWNTVMPDTDSKSLDEPVSQYLPDGSENPYYGHTPGGVFFWGMRQYNYFKFRVNLYSETTESPTLPGFRVFYQDSTLGEGHIAEINLEGKEQYQTVPEGESR